jgi:hypothetical protein
MRNVYKIILLLVFLGATFTQSGLARRLEQDPYENAWDDTHIKKFYLRRLTNSMEANDPQFTFKKDEIYRQKRSQLPMQDGIEAGWSHNDGGGTYYGGWASASSRIMDSLWSISPKPHLTESYYPNPPGNTSEYPVGKVYMTTDSTELAPLFEKVAKKIKTRLVK